MRPMEKKINMAVETFHVLDNNAEADWIMERVKAFRFFPAPEGDPWAHGASRPYMEKLRAHWLDSYNWGACVARLNRFPHFRAEVEPGLKLHFIHKRSSRADAIPLMMAHGWPGSVLEFETLIDRLAEPGDDALPAFHVIVPSLPGYAWSDAPKGPIGPRAIAGLYGKLMTMLGYPRFLFQGGDWGSMIGGWLGLESGQLVGLHLNGFGLRPADMKPIDDAQAAWLKRAMAFGREEFAYLRLQGTKPQSLAFAMMDSPMGVAAWFAEKFRGWTDHDGMDDEPPLSLDLMLDNIMIYLTTNSFSSASWVYRGHFQEGGFAMPKGARVEVPTAVASFPRDLMAFPPDEMVLRGYNMVQRTDMPRGGHFAGLEAPELLLDDVRKFAAKL